MDTQAFQLEDAQEHFAAGSFGSYDEELLGVECAWPTPEREELLAHH
jgi:hypothetical protein